MARNFRLWQAASVASLLAPAADAAGRTSVYVSLKNGHKAYIVCHLTQGNAAQVTFTPLQASDVSGAGSKAVGVMPIVANLDAATTDALVVQASAANYQTDAGLKNKVVIFEIDPIESMDINNTSGAFDCVAIQTSASNAANITSAMLILMPLRFAQQTPPSVLTN